MKQRLEKSQKRSMKRRIVLRLKKKRQKIKNTETTKITEKINLNNNCFKIKKKKKKT